MPRIHHGVYSTLSCADLRSNSLVRQVDKVQGDLNFAEEVPQLVRDLVQLEVYLCGTVHP